MNTAVHAPYIGITGFTHTSEVWGELHRTRVQVATACGRLLMVGVLASLETLTNRSHRRPQRYPDLRLLRELLPADDGVLNLIHYHTAEPESLAGQLTVLMPWAGEHCHGVQLNVPWPEPTEVEIFRRRYPRARIVLQCGTKALRLAMSSGDLIGRLRAYTTHRLVDDILLDPSGGQALPFNPQELLRLLRTCRDNGLLEVQVDQGRPVGYPLGIGVAGGLYADNVHLLADLLTEFPQLSCDAEGRLRNGHDDLDVTAATEYVVQVAELLGVPPAP